MLKINAEKWPKYAHYERVKKEHEHRHQDALFGTY